MTDAVFGNSRFKRCRVCGQLFDTEDLDQVFYHGPEPHEPGEAAPSDDD